jgi:hypothetical protein
VNFLAKRDLEEKDEDVLEKGKIISNCHDTPAAGHPETKRMLALLTRRGHQWKGIQKDVMAYVRGCVACQKNKSRVGPFTGELHPFNIPGTPWEVMAWDLIGPLPESRTYNAIVTMVDIKTKAIKLEPADITITARGAVIVMKNRVFREDGLPAKVISDRGPQFVSGFMKELYDMLGIQGNPSTAYPLHNPHHRKISTNLILRIWTKTRVSRYLVNTRPTSYSLNS